MTHYEVLGVSRTATSDEVRAAYRRAARDAHPDRHGEASAARMAAVNEAWRVLGDPVRRQRYDLELADGPSASAGPAGPRSRPGATAATSAPSATSTAPAAPLATGQLSRFPWRFFAVIGVLAIGVVFVGNVLGDPDPPVPVDVILAPGECVQIVDEAMREILPVACDGTHDAVVAAVVGFDGACATGTERFRDPQGRGTACLTRVVPIGG